MTIGITAEHLELAESLKGWAASRELRDTVRAVEHDPAESFDDATAFLAEMELSTVLLDEAAGGAGGDLLDLAVMVSACGSELLPGPLLSSAVTQAAIVHTGNQDAIALVVDGARVCFSLGSDHDALVHDAPGATHLLAPDASGAWQVVELGEATITANPVLDLTRRTGRISRAELGAAIALPELTDSHVNGIAATVAAAEAAGVAQWCVTTAAAYAKVREQFGKPIGSFQAVKHLCAEMLERSQAIGAAAWDAASAYDEADREQWQLATDVAIATVFDGTVQVAKDCIQVLGGIGFTYEHDAHLYLRRAVALRASFGGADAAADRLVEQARGGQRRSITVDLGGADAEVRDEIRSLVGQVAIAPNARKALVSTGLLVPHYPKPFGLGADAVTQIVVDQELGAAGMDRPDLVIAAWALPTIIEHGTTEQRDRFVDASLRGEVTWCQLFSEPGAGSDLAALRTKAERVDGGWKLTGQKVWTSVAERADWGICLARTDPEAPKHKGISYFLVDMQSAGIDIRPLREITGEALFNEVFLDDVFVPDDCLVAGEGDGWKLARTTLANERVAMGGSSLGSSVEAAIGLLSDTGSNGASDSPASVSLSEAMRRKLGYQIARSTISVQLGVRSTMRSIEGRGPGAESSVAKLLGVRNRQDSAELLVELHGEALLSVSEAGRAALREMLNTRCLSIAGGTTQILRNVAGERILGLPR